MDKTKKNNLVISLLALMFSILLFFNANAQNLQTSLYSTTEKYDESLDGIVINPLYDSNQYYIHGFDSKVSVELTSANRIQLNTEANAGTRNFKVVADLTNLEEGTHEVRLRMQNLSNAVSAKIEPSTITVTIEKRVTKEFTVEPVVAASSLSDGFTVDSYVASPQVVEITTGDKTLAEIKRVVATVDPSTSYVDNFTEEATIQALNDQDEPLSIISNPETVKVTVKVIAPEREIPIFATQSGNPPEGISHYEFYLEQSTLLIKGEQSVIDQVSGIGISIDVSDINKETTKLITVPTENNYVAEPSKVQVRIVPVFTAGSTSDTSTAASTSESTNATTSETSASSEQETEASSQSNDE